MNMSQLKALVKKGESEVLEFKKSTAQLSAAMQTVCAFLNSDVGGTVLIGVTDDGKILGQTISDGTRKEIAGEISKLEPHTRIDIDYVTVKSGLLVIVFMVSPGNKTPYVYDGRPFLRNQSTTRKMPQEVYEQFFLERGSTSWETMTNARCVISDLDQNRIRQIVRAGVSSGRLPESSLNSPINEILARLKLMVDNKLTNAAVILFCKDEFKQFPQSFLKLARFAGVTKSEFIDNKQLTGNAFDLYDEAMKFLHVNLPISGKIPDDSSYRVDTPAIPLKVLREALVNALCHRDYSITGGSIAVAVYDDRVEIGSTGLLPRGVKVSQLSKEHLSVLRNKLISDVFFICHMIERWGRGTQDMIKLCKQSGNSIPIFEEVTGSLLVSLPLKEPMRNIGVSTKQRELLEGLTSRQQEIMIILRGGAMSREQIMENLKDAPSSRTVQKDLLMLCELDLITKSGGIAGRYIKWSISK